MVDCLGTPQRHGEKERTSLVQRARESQLSGHFSKYVCFEVALPTRKLSWEGQDIG